MYFFAEEGGGGGCSGYSTSYIVVSAEAGLVLGSCYEWPFNIVSVGVLSRAHKFNGVVANVFLRECQWAQ